MTNNATLNQGQAVYADEVLKLTALIYLQEALFKQEYEQCKDLIQSAKKFGATQSDISALIAAYVRAEQTGGQHGAVKSRLRSLKKEQ